MSQSGNFTIISFHFFVTIKKKKIPMSMSPLHFTERSRVNYAYRGGLHICIIRDPSSEHIELWQIFVWS